jgi:hypothetical protein
VLLHSTLGVWRFPLASVEMLWSPPLCEMLGLVKAAKDKLPQCVQNASAHDLAIRYAVRVLIWFPLGLVCFPASRDRSQPSTAGRDKSALR